MTVRSTFSAGGTSQVNMAAQIEPPPPPAATTAAADTPVITTPPVHFRICGTNMATMPQLRISEAAELLGVSDDTVRRMADAGRIATRKDSAGRLTVSGRDLAALAQEVAAPPAVGPVHEESARNRMRGIVTRVVKDT